jgi:hypothetical protein
LIAARLAIGVCAAHAQQPFVTIDPEPASNAWWLRASFHPFGTKVRGISIDKISKDWCKANEFTKKLLADLIIEDGKDVMAENKLSFAVEGFFDGSKTRQTAVVGVYEKCAGEKGTFLLVLDQPRNGASKIRFLSHTAREHLSPFSALSELIS